MRKFIILFITLFFFISLFKIWLENRSFGPIISNISIAYLDRNNNGISDTLKIDFSVLASEKIIGFGGIEICLGKNNLYFNCQNISYESTVTCIDTSGHALLSNGENNCTRYIYINKNSLNRKADSIKITMIGDNNIHMQRFATIPNINLTSFEFLPFGEQETGYSQYIDFNNNTFEN